MRAWGSIDDAGVGLSHWRAPAVDLVDHVNEQHPTILFHAAGGRSLSEPCDRFRAGGVGWPGEAMLVPSGAQVRCRWDEPTEWMHVYFRPGLLEQAAYQRRGVTLTELQDRSHVRDPRIARLLGRLFASRWRPADDPLLGDLVAQELIDATLDAFSPAAGAMMVPRYRITPLRLKTVLAGIEERLDRAVRVQELAELAGLSPAHFARAFRAETGWPPHRYLLMRRIERAKRHLQEGRLTGAEVAVCTGFSSLPHLSATLTRATGLGVRGWSRRR